MVPYGNNWVRVFVKTFNTSLINDFFLMSFVDVYNVSPQSVFTNRAFSHDVTATILVFLNNKTAATVKIRK